VSDTHQKRENLTAMVKNNRCNINILTKMLSPLAEGNFCDKHGKGLKTNYSTRLKKTYGTSGEI